MVNRVLTCPKCGKVVETEGLGFVQQSDHVSRKAHSERRLFRGHCAEHGSFVHEITGHHFTFVAPDYGAKARYGLNALRECDFDPKREFPKAVQQQLLPHLSPVERRTFNEMLKGFSRPDWDWLTGLKSKYIKKNVI